MLMALLNLWTVVTKMTYLVALETSTFVSTCSKDSCIAGIIRGYPKFFDRSLVSCSNLLAMLITSSRLSVRSFTIKSLKIWLCNPRINPMTAA